MINSRQFWLQLPVRSKWPPTVLRGFIQELEDKHDETDAHSWHWASSLEPCLLGYTSLVNSGIQSQKATKPRAADGQDAEVVQKKRRGWCVQGTLAHGVERAGLPAICHGRDEGALCLSIPGWARYQEFGHEEKCNLSSSVLTVK